MGLRASLEVSEVVGFWQRLRRCLALDSAQLEHRIHGVLARQMREDAVSTPIFGLAIALLLTVDGSPARVAAPALVWFWLSGLCFWGGLAWLISRAFRRSQNSERRIALWRYVFTAAYTANALFWMLLIFIDHWGANPVGEAFVMLVMLGLLMAYMVNVSPHAPSLLAANAVVFLVGMGSVAVQNGELIRVVQFIYPIFSVFLLVQGFRSHRRFADSMDREIKMAALAADLSRANRQVQQESRAKAEFFATMSHELRTPLNAITGFADLMQQEILGPLGHQNYCEYIADIRTSSDHMLYLVEQLLSLAELDSGQVSLQEKPVPLVRLLAAAARAIETYAWEAGVRTDLRDTADVSILVDSRQLELALVRVATVLCDSLPQGENLHFGGRIDAGGECVIVVSGNVEGITPETLLPLVDPFRRGDSWIAKGNFGSGLGLMVSQRLSELHDGRIEIEHRPGQETEVRICLPAERVLNGPMLAPAPRRQASA